MLAVCGTGVFVDGLDLCGRAFLTGGILLGGRLFCSITAPENRERSSQ